MKTRSLDERWSKLPSEVREEIEHYETEIYRFLDGKAPEKVFLEFRLRYGTYGQRQPDVQMLRIKIPMGKLDAAKMEVLADISEEYADGISHITTRQDVQVHFVNLLDCPDIFRRLAEVGITTREACGNTVRNVTACPFAGVCSDETFDVSQYAEATTYFLLRHPDTQDFGRKFKIAFSGCAEHACGLARMHDIGAVARVREIDGKAVRGFELYVGGGLGAVPHQAELFDEFLPPEELLPTAQAIARVFAKHGEKKNRARARMKFLVAGMGIDTFRKEVLEERAKLPDDPRWTEFLADVDATDDEPLKPGSTLDLESGNISPAFKKWYESNVRPQRQDGYSAVTVFLPLGDLTAEQLRCFAGVAGKYTRGTVRTTVPQNLVLRWVSNSDLPALHQDLVALKLGAGMADTIGDLTACPGTDSCKLGIASSRGLAGVLHREFAKAHQANGAELRKDISVKMSGCFNSCGQHHIANIGFFGSSKRKGGRVAPVFQVILGGNAEGNADAYGLMVAKVAAHHAPKVVHKLADLYDKERQNGESFNQVMDRLGKARIRTELSEFSDLGDTEAFYHDNRQPWEYVKHVEAGECAGEVVTRAEFLLEDAERMVFEAELQLDDSHGNKAAELALGAMKSSADALLSAEGLLLSDQYDTAKEFLQRFKESGRFFPGVADYYLRAVEKELAELRDDQVRDLVQEANLFTEEAHVVYGRMAGQATK